ncbi:PqqD family protein [Helcococcus ovis]|uniref:PqqD family protein n=1 Tax=Helcococcus ovis TaxID=72026 RepID=UPI00106F0B57|nr:PqqD family protein [Helcococcus ovis]TFF68692.1 PqqD family protein [Helcococcus ovis]WNZ01633.1 PqqD family protein [Helcococcus ovis]
MNKDISYTILTNKTLIVNKGNNKSIVLDKSGTEIWRLILDKKSKEEIIEILSDRYKGFSDEIKSDVSEFFEILTKYEVI